MARKKSWCEKLEDSKGLPKVEEITEKMSKRWDSGTVVIPAPIEVDEIMQRVPEGKLVTINEIRAALARKHGATIDCPIATGIFAWSRLMLLKKKQGKAKKTLLLTGARTLKTGGLINENYPGGVEVQKRLLEKEGHRVIQKGKNHMVVDYEKALARI